MRDVMYVWRCFLISVIAIFITLLTAEGQNCDFAFTLTGADDFRVYTTTLSRDGNILVLGSFKGQNVDFDPGVNLELRDSPSVTNAFIANYTPEGTLNWVQTMGGNAHLVLTDIAVDPSGKIYACGWCRGTDVDLDPGAGNSNHRIEANTTGMVVAYYSANGTYRWGFIVPAEQNAAFQSSVVANKIAIDADNNILVCGIFQTSRVDFDPGLGTSTYATANTGTLNNYDAFIAKYDRNGAFIWSAAIQSNDFDLASSLSVDDAGNTYLCGAFSGTNTVFSGGSGATSLSATGATDIFVSKYDSEGNLVWARNMGGPDNDQAKDIKLDKEGNLLMTGVYRGTARMEDGENPRLLSSLGDADCFVTKHNSKGELLFARTIGSEKFDSPGRMAINDRDEVLLTGLYHAAANNDFDPGESTKSLSSDTFNSNNYLFVTSLNNRGELNWASAGTALSGIVGVSVMPLANNTLIVAGEFNASSASEVFLGENKRAVATGGKAGIVVATFSAQTSVFGLVRHNNKIEIYPNPVVRQIHFKTADTELQTAIFKANLFSSSGNVVFNGKGNLIELQSKINRMVGDLLPGYYMVRLHTKTYATTLSFVKHP